MWKRREMLHIFGYTYIGIRIKRMQMEKQDRYMTRVVCTSIGTVT